MTQHAGKFDATKASATLLDDAFPKRWKLLITVIDCSHTPRLLNPPKSIEALKARISAAVGIDSGKAHHGHGEATAQAIFSGLEGPERRALDCDEDLCSFWENVKAGEGVSSPVSRSTDERTPKNQRDRSPSKIQHGKTREFGDSTPTAYDESQSHGSTPTMASSSRPMLPKMPIAGSDSFLGMVEEESEGLEDDSREDLDFEQREKAMNREMIICDERRMAAEAQLEDARGRVEMLTHRKEEVEGQLKESEEKCQSLQQENLQFISAFDEHVELRKAELAAELDKKYQVQIKEQGRILAETRSQVGSLQGQLEMREDKIKELEGQLREQRSAFRDLASGFDEEREQFEEERKRLASKVQRVRQLEFLADCWRRKVNELTDVTGKELRQEEDSLQYRIGSISVKIAEFQKGRLVQSPEFEVPELGKVQFEFFPTGDVNSREGWCSFRLRVPNNTRLRWSAFIGKKRIGPRTDHFDQRQWWCRYGLLWLNFCPLSEVRSEISPETDTLLCGIEVQEILPNVAEEIGTPLEAAMPVPRDRFGIMKGVGEQSKSLSSSLGSRQKGIQSLLPVAASPPESVEVREYNAEDDGDLAASGATQQRGIAWRAGAGSPQADKLPPATPASTTSLGGSSSALAGLSASRGSPLAQSPNKGLASQSPNDGRQLARPQSVPSGAWRKDAQRRR